MTEKTQQLLIISILIVSIFYLITSTNIINNQGNIADHGVVIDVDEPKIIDDYHENGISIGKVEGGVTSGSGTINNTHVKVGG